MASTGETAVASAESAGSAIPGPIFESRSTNDKSGITELSSLVTTSRGVSAVGEGTDVAGDDGGESGDAALDELIRQQRVGGCSFIVDLLFSVGRAAHLPSGRWARRMSGRISPHPRTAASPSRQLELFHQRLSVFLAGC